MVCDMNEFKAALWSVRLSRREITTALAAAGVVVSTVPLAALRKPRTILCRWTDFPQSQANSSPPCSEGNLQGKFA
jgi:hypothetical protein